MAGAKVKQGCYAQCYYASRELCVCPCGAANHQGGHQHVVGGQEMSVGGEHVLATSVSGDSRPADSTPPPPPGGGVMVDLPVPAPSPTIASAPATAGTPAPAEGYETHEAIGQDEHTLTEEQRGAVYAYSGMHYQAINGAIRNGTLYDDFYWETSNGRMMLAASEYGDITEVRADVEALDQAFASVTPLTRPIRIEHAATYTAEQLNCREGETVVKRGFFSTTASPAPTRRSVLRVTVPAGGRVIDVNETSESEFPDENEVLLPRGTQLFVTRVERHGETDYIDATAVVETT